MFGSDVESVSADSVFLDGARFDPATGEIAKGTDVLRLEPKAAEVLNALASKRGQVVSRRTLLDRCWGEGGGSDEALTQAVAQIRRALDTLGLHGGWIQTHAKRGYRLRDPEVEIRSAETLVEQTVIRPTRSIAKIVFWSTVAAILLAWIIFPHAARHLIRHSLGLGPPIQYSPR